MTAGPQPGLGLMGGTGRRLNTERGILSCPCVVPFCVAMPHVCLILALSMPRVCPSYWLCPCLVCVLHTGSVTCMMVSSTVSWLLPVPGPYPPSTTRAMLQTGLIALQNASIGMPGNHRNQIRYSEL